MSNAATYAELFNRKMHEFFEDLEVIGITEVQEYPLLKASCQVMASIDKRHPPEMFLKYVVGPYETQITSQDEAFFMQDNAIPGVSDMPLVHAIKQIWSTLDDHNKSAVWKHMQVLTALAHMQANAAN